MKAKTKTFDAVRESRRWKEAVVQRTAGMSRAEVLQFFNSAKAATPRRHQTVDETCMLREEPPKA